MEASVFSFNKKTTSFKFLISLERVAHEKHKNCTSANSNDSPVFVDALVYKCWYIIFFLLLILTFRYITSNEYPLSRNWLKKYRKQYNFDNITLR